MDKKKRSRIAKEIAALMDTQSLTQAALADKIGVSPSRISEWLAGDRSPSSDALFRLAKEAPPPQNLWFLEQVGISRQMLVDVSRGVEKDSQAYSAELVEKGDVVLVPRFRYTLAGKEDAGDTVPLPAEFIPNPSTTICVIVDSEATAIVSSPRGVLLVDTSCEGIGDLSELWGRFVVVEFNSPSYREQDLFLSSPYSGKGLVVGRATLWHPQFYSPQRDAVIIPASLRTAETSTEVGFAPSLGSHLEVGVLTGVVEGERAPKMHEVQVRAKSELRLPKGIKIFGEVIGRLTGHLKARAEE